MLVSSPTLASTRSDPSPSHLIHPSTGVVGQPIQSSVEMKGAEVATLPAAMANEGRSPMINIPAAIVKEFMSGDSNLINQTSNDTLITTNGLTNNTILKMPLTTPNGLQNNINNSSTVSNGTSNGLATSKRKSVSPPLSNLVNNSVSNSSLNDQSNLTAMDTSESRLSSLDTNQSSLSINQSLSESSLLTSSLSALDSLSPTLDELPDITYTTLIPLAPVTSSQSPLNTSADESQQSSELMELTPVQMPNTTASAVISNNNNETIINGENTSLKRSLSPEETKNETKKQKLSDPLAASNKKKSKLNSQKNKEEKILKDEIENIEQSSLKLHKLKRKDLEGLILEMFMDKLLHDHELGKYKSLCERLEATLETNRKKTAQFHKEMEDLRKVTKRLREEHASRKEQLVTPIKIKRSVGIQAAPHIIQRGLTAPTKGVICPLKGRPQPYSATFNGQPVAINTSMAGSPARTSTGGVRLAPAPLHAPTERRFLLTQPLHNNNNSNNVVSAPTNSSAIIDLTDEEEGRGAALNSRGVAGVMKGVTAANISQGLVKGLVNTTPTTFTTLSSVMAPQFLLLSNNTTTPATTLMVNMTSNGGSLPSTVTQSTTGARILLPGMAAHAPKPAPPIVATHPAPLPNTPPQQVVGGAKNVPPQPTLKLSHKDNSIVLSWTMNKTAEHEGIASYQLYAYQEGSQKPSAALWKKVGSVKALELPMACTLTQFMPGHRYHFAVRAVDTKNRIGNFSDARSIRLEK